MAHSLFITLKKQHAGCDIDVVALDEQLPLLLAMPEVQRVISLPVQSGSGQPDLGQPGMGTYYRLGLKLADQDYDRAFVLPDSLSSALTPFFAEIPERTGWRGAMRYWLLNDIRLFSRRRYPTTLHRFAALAYAPADPAGCGEVASFPKPRLVVDPEAASQGRAEQGFDNRPLLLFCPGGESPWPVTEYRALAEQCAAQGWQLALVALEEGGAAARALAEHLPEALLRLLSLGPLLELVASAQAVMANDRDLLALAAGLHKPTLICGEALSDWPLPVQPVTGASDVFNTLTDIA